MHRSAWMWAGLVAVSAGAGVAHAQTPVAPAPPISVGGAKGWAPAWNGPPSCCPTLPPLVAPSPTPGSTPTPTPSPTPAPTESPTGTSEFRTFGQTNLVQSNLALAGSGTSATSAAASTGAAAGSATTPSTLSTLTPTILPGLLTAASVQSPRPMDRVFFAYSYLDRFQVVGGGVPLPPSALVPGTVPTALTTSPAIRQPGFNLNVYYLGVEKTFFNGMASVYVLAPFLQATNNVTTQAIDGFGNLSAGFKAVLLSDASSGSLLSGGFTASVPTGHSTTYATSQLATIIAPATTPTVLTTSTRTTNPTYLQPWLAGLLAGDRVFVQEYLGVIIPTDTAVSTFINNDIAVGYRMYRGAPGSFISAVTPIVDLQALLPVNHVGSATSGTIAGTPIGNAGAAIIPPTPIFGSNNLTFSDQIFLTSGVQIGLGNRAVFSTGIITPLAGPKAFNWGVTAGLNFFY